MRFDGRLPCWLKPANRVVFETDTVLSLDQTSHLLKYTEAFKNTENSSSGYRPLQTWKRHALDASIR